MDVLVEIDRVIKEIWKEEILSDYSNDFLLKEDSLKNAFYHHLRMRLGDGYLKRNRIRIFTEYYLDGNERADIAIVKLLPKREMSSKQYNLRNRVKELLAVIELKHKNNSCGCDLFFDDVEKVKRYIGIQKYQRCQFYLGFIHETEYSREESSWLAKRQQISWAQGRLTELTAFYEMESGYFDMKVISYNKLNQVLNSKV